MYLDLLMLLNFGVDYLLLLGTQRFFGARGNRGRLLASAALGAIYSGGCLVPRSEEHTSEQLTLAHIE